MDRGKTVYPPPPSGSGGIIISYKQIISHLDEAFSNTDAPQADFILSMSEKNNNKFMKPGKTHLFSLNLIKLQNTFFNLFAMNGSYTQNLSKANCFIGLKVI